VIFEHASRGLSAIDELLVNKRLSIDLRPEIVLVAAARGGQNEHLVWNCVYQLFEQFYDAVKRTVSVLTFWATRYIQRTHYSLPIISWKLRFCWLRVQKIHFYIPVKKQGWQHPLHPKFRRPCKEGRGPEKRKENVGERYTGDTIPAYVYCYQVALQRNHDMWPLTRVSLTLNTRCAERENAISCLGAWSSDSTRDDHDSDISIVQPDQRSVNPLTHQPS